METLWTGISLSHSYALHEGLPNKSRMYEIHGHQITKGRGYFVFNFADHNYTVEFVRSHFLVREGTRINEQGHTTSLSDLVTIQAPNLTTWPPMHGHFWGHVLSSILSLFILKIILHPLSSHNLPNPSFFFNNPNSIIFHL